MLHHHGRWEFAAGEFPALLGYAAVVIYACVPETDQMPTVWVMVAGLLAIELVTRVPSAWPVQVTAGVIVLWSGLYGATGRGSAVVGAWFAFWPMVLAFASTLVPGARSPHVRWMIGAIGGVAAIAVARTGAIEPTTAPALAAVAIAAPASLGVAGLVIAFSDRRGAPASRR